MTINYRFSSPERLIDFADGVHQELKQEHGGYKPGFHTDTWYIEGLDESGMYRVSFKRHLHTPNRLTGSRLGQFVMGRSSFPEVEFTRVSQFDDYPSLDVLATLDSLRVRHGVADELVESQEMTLSTLQLIQDSVHDLLETRHALQAEYAKMSG